jgi:hypothetical protein
VRQIASLLDRLSDLAFRDQRAYLEKTIVRAGASSGYSDVTRRFRWFLLS